MSKTNAKRPSLFFARDVTPAPFAVKFDLCHGINGLCVRLPRSLEHHPPTRSAFGIEELGLWPRENSVVSVDKLQFMGGATAVVNIRLGQ